MTKFLEIDALRRICKPESFEITIHAAQQIMRRNILLSDIISCINTGEIIEQYPDDYPYPSCLILGYSDQHKPLHAVIGSNQQTLWLITAYYPDIAKWQSDFKTRKEQKL